MEGYLISLDAKKAFDSVDHVFIEETLKRFNVNLEFIKIFKILYNQISSRTLLNGFISESKARGCLVLCPFHNVYGICNLSYTT
jgi:hypothetical protein